MFVFILLIF